MFLRYYAERAKLSKFAKTASLIIAGGFIVIKHLFSNIIDTHVYNVREKGVWPISHFFYWTLKIQKQALFIHVSILSHTLNKWNNQITTSL